MQRNVWISVKAGFVILLVALLLTTYTLPQGNAHAKTKSVTFDIQSAEGAFPPFLASSDVEKVNDTQAKITLNNSSRLWLCFSKSAQGAQLSSGEQYDVFNDALFATGIIPPSSISFLEGSDQGVSIAKQSVTVMATFNDVGQTATMQFDPFCTNGAALDIMEYLLDILKGFVHVNVSAEAVVDLVENVVPAFEKLPDFSAAISDYIQTLHDMQHDNYSDAVKHATSFANHAVALLGKGDHTPLTDWLVQWSSTKTSPAKIQAGIKSIVGEVFNELLDLGKTLLSLILKGVSETIVALADAVEKVIGQTAFFIQELVSQYAPYVTVKTVAKSQTPPTNPPSGGGQNPPSTPPTNPPVGGGPNPPTNPPASGPAPTDNSQVVSTPAIVASPGQAIAMQFTFLNDGNTTWSSGNYSLVCDTYYHPNTNCMGAGSVDVGQSVGPQQTHTFTVNGVAPTSPGVYQSWWSVAHAGNIFGNNNNYVQVTVQQPAQPPTFHPWYSVHRPYCDDTGAWNGDVNQSTTHNCNSSPNGVVVSQYGYYPAEMDLDTPNGASSYNQSLFQVQTTASMLNPSDANVFTAMIVQTPENPSQHGGYIFGLNSLGDCYIWQVQSNGSFSNYAVASRLGVGFNPSQFTLQVVVQNGQLTGYLNGQAILSTGDNLSSGVVGLMTFSSKPTSTATLFSDFILSQWS